jgi:hypothetical protein
MWNTGGNAAEAGQIPHMSRQELENQVREQFAHFHGFFLLVGDASVDQARLAQKMRN